MEWSYNLYLNILAAIDLQLSIMHIKYDLYHILYIIMIDGLNHNITLLLGNGMNFNTVVTVTQ